MMIESIDTPYIHAVNADTYLSLVVANSNAGPVLVNFWSKKAGPCLRQYPILDKLTHQYQGRLLLVNIDVDQEIQLSKELNIASVPTLKLFRHEVIVETLFGYQSENDLMTLLDQYVTRDSDQTLANAIKHFSEGDRAAAYNLLTKVIVDDPDNPRLPLALCKLLKYEQRYAEALTLLQSVPEKIKENKEIIILRDQLSFQLIACEIDDVEALVKRSTQFTRNVKDLKQLAAHYVLSQKYEEAMEALIQLMDIDQTYDNDYARLSMLKIFNVLGKDHPLVVKNRPSLRRYKH